MNPEGPCPHGPGMHTYFDLRVPACQETGHPDESSPMGMRIRGMPRIRMEPLIQLIQHLL